MPCLFPVYNEPPNGKLNPGNIAQYNVCENGIFLTKSMCSGTITVKVDGLPGCGEGKEYISILKRKIPMTVFWQTVDFFRYVEESQGDKDLEAYVLVGWNPKTEKYFISVPPQKVGAASVDYDISTFRTEHPGCYIIMDIHSHTSRMGAFFSGTDDNDDNRDRFSMVLGMISKIIPEYKVRFCTMKKRQDYDLEDIFEDSDEDIEMEPFPEAVKRIAAVSYVYTPTKYGALYDWEDYYSAGAWVPGARTGQNYGSAAKVHPHGAKAQAEKKAVQETEGRALSASQELVSDDEDQMIYAAIANKLKNTDGTFLIAGI